MSELRKETWERYASSWKTESPEEKKALYEASLAPTCVYHDPMMKAHGYDELLAYMVDFHKQVPGGHFVTTSFLSHSDKSIATWDMKSGDGQTLGNGISYGEYNQEGKLTSMTGFFETPST